MLFAAGDVAASGDHLFYVSLFLVLGWFVMALGLMLAGWTGHGSAKTIGLAGLLGLAGLVGGHAGWRRRRASCRGSRCVL